MPLAMRTSCRNLASVNFGLIIVRCLHCGVLLMSNTCILLLRLVCCVNVGHWLTSQTSFSATAPSLFRFSSRPYCVSSSLRNTLSLHINARMKPTPAKAMVD